MKLQLSVESESLQSMSRLSYLQSTTTKPYHVILSYQHSTYCFF